MSEIEEQEFQTVAIGQREESTGPENHMRLNPSEGQKEEAAPSDCGTSENSRPAALDQFKIRRFFVLRPGTLNQAIEDIQAMVDKEVDGSVLSVWLMAEVDHWNNEKERVVVITNNSLLICKYDFMMLNCEQISRIPLNFVDRISHGSFTFPKGSLLMREGEGLRIFWDRLREPSFTSRWNPFATDYPFITFTYHPVRNTNDKFAALCEVSQCLDHRGLESRTSVSSSKMPPRKPTL
ncbi:tumor protein p63-regulated gene 1 protein isoform X2 [Lampris incognitus]|uniref:tumor protein p63-regulated gene 1 protein isoform X2 n=1 Tax=Lampris incognitus TaxID=2546036 RepID=UPI0024B4CEA5|nr:tumor protein p63-regulated gene 1 protein isoform X2 [Lampris incognitus]